MKKVVMLFLLTFITGASFANNPLTAAFTTGNPEVKSMSVLSFGPEGILFIGDSQGAQVIAIDLSKAEKINNAKVGIPDIEILLGQLLGSDIDQLQVTDMAVNPQNQNIYISVQHSSGKAMLFVVNNDSLEEVPLESVSFSKIGVTDVVAEDAKDDRGRPLRQWAISDLDYADGKVMLSGLSNAEFASTFRTMPFPFTEKQEQSSLEIYHAAHGKYETSAPIKAFTTVTMNNAPTLIASYTCTPLVVFPLESLKPGTHTKGRTVAELGNWNTPLDIIAMEKEGKHYILIANSSRAVMKIALSDIEAFGDSITTPVEQRSATAGVDFINLPFVNVQHLDKLNDIEFIMVQREGNGKLALKTSNNRWL